MGKLSFDISLNTSQYTAGARSAQNANRDLEKSTKDYLDSFGPLRKQLSQAKKDAQNLAAAFAMLSQTERESEIGKQMADDLDFAIHKAAELQNAMKDVNGAINRTASDTAGIEGMKEAFDIGKSAATAFAGALVGTNGDAKALNATIKALAITEGAFGTVMKTATALQKESKMMTALQEAGVISYTQAVKINTAVEKVSIATTKVLGLAIQALPIVALVGALALAIKGIVSLTTSEDKAAEATKKLHEEMHKASIDSAKDAQTELTKVNLLYNKTQNLNLSYEDRLQAVKDIKNQYPGYFKDLTDEQILAGNAADAYRQLASDILKCAEARAYENKITDIAKDNIDLEDKKADLEDKIAKQERRLTEAKNAAANVGTNGAANVNLGAANVKKQSEILEGYRQELQETEEQLARNKEQQQRYADSIDNTTSAVNRYKANTTKTNSTKTPKQTVKIEPQIKPLEIKSKLQELKDQLKKEQTNLEFAISEEDVQEAQKRIKNLKEKIQKEEIRLGVKVEVDLSKAKDDVDKILKDLNKPKQKDYDFSVLPKGFQEQANQIVNRLRDVESARNKLQDTIDKNNKAATNGDKQAIEYINQAQRGLASTDAEYKKLIDDAEKFDKVASKIKKRNEQFEAFQNTVSTIGDAIGSIDGVVGAIKNMTNVFEEGADGWEQFMAVVQTAMSIMNAVTTVIEMVNAIQDVFNVKKEIGEAAVAGEAAAHTANATAIAAEAGADSALITTQSIAIATTLGLAKAAKLLAASQIFAAHAYIPFAGVGIATGLIAEMEAVLAPLMAFANGGIVGGNSYSGDKVVARLNSGEMVLNGNQQRRLFDIANGLITPSTGNVGNIGVVGVLHGKDILLVQKNYNAIGSKSKQNIKIG